MKLIIGSLKVLLLLVFWSCSEPDLPADVAEAMKEIPQTVDYNLHVKPILSDRCFACHGPDENKRKGDLRLDIPEGYDKVSDETGRKALVAGSLAESEVFHRITSKDSSMMMPAPESNLSLTSKEKAILIKWIQHGAKYEKHWSLVTPVKPGIPEVTDSSWTKNAIDNFVLAKLEEKGMKPNEQASRETLIRRLSFDLTGLPPTIPEIDSFLADKSPNAYEKVVNRLLSSPHYGERMAVDWLDAARYADTHGYQDDGHRNSYPWRDWVISAFNNNLPYDKFITWQLAGDLLPNASKEQIIATSFLRNHPQSQEGGIVDEEYRIEYVADRVNVLGKALLAQSTECARCHDHKYDAISQKNYYELFAFFNNNKESGEVPYAGEASPTLILTTPEVDKILNFIDQELAPLEEKEKNLKAFQPDFERWLAKKTGEAKKNNLTNNGLLGYFSFDEKLEDLNAGKPAQRNKNKKVDAPVDLEAKIITRQNLMPEQVKGRFGEAVLLGGDMGVVFDRGFVYERNHPFAFSLWVKTFKPDETGPLFGRSAGDLNGWRGYMCELNEDQTLSIRLNHVYPANAIDLITTEQLKPEQWHHLALSYDGSSRASGVKFYLDGKELDLKVITDNLKKSILHDKNNFNQGGGGRKFLLGREERASITNVAFDEFRAYNRQISPLEVLQLSGKKDLLDSLLKKPAQELSPEQERLLMEYYVLSQDKKYDEIRQLLIKNRGKQNDILTKQEEVMVYKERKEPRPTFILDRGLYDMPTERVYPNTPESILPFDEDLPRNRLGLSKWLTSKKNPLFSRVVVNRLWQQCFGRGIVKTADDFGNQGDLPTHPKLLDWLSVSFRENGWDIKAFLKTVVMSATYRQKSVPAPQNKKQDPANKYLSYAPAYRMSAEIIRDNALASSGLLVRDIGGKSVYPYQPPGVWKALAVRNDVEYDQGTGEDLYRRSLYTIWKRSSPPPSMTIFDVPDRYTCTVERQNTSTPLQALILMNDVQYIEAARVLGEKMILNGGKTPEAQITYAFRALTSRYPRKEEMKILMDLYQEEYKDFQKDPKRAQQLLKVGEYHRNQKLSTNEVATCGIIAHTLMNFDEFITKR